jgi:hypothetical protein
MHHIIVYSQDFLKSAHKWNKNNPKWQLMKKGGIIWHWYFKILSLDVFWRCSSISLMMLNDVSVVISLPGSYFSISDPIILCNLLLAENRLCSFKSDLKDRLCPLLPCLGGKLVCMVQRILLRESRKKSENSIEAVSKHEC